MTQTPNVLVVDDDDGVRFTLTGILEDAGLPVTQADGGERALEAIALLERDNARFSVVITDLRMPGMDGLALLDAIRRRPSPPRVVLLTAHGSERVAVDAMKRGAYDYFRKPFEVDELLAVVRRALEADALARRNEALASELALSQHMVFASAAMRRVAALVAKLGPRDVTVLVRGESGTGKERIAEALVRASPRADRPFVRFNCAAVSAELAEAELFGHTRGAFTGAHRERPGLFRAADGGTILLDEIGELDLATQAKLLRVLQEREVRPVGDDRAHAVDVRVIAATHRQLDALVAEDAFREDLYYRVAVVTLEVPPLRERPEDVEPIARHLLAQATERFGLDPIDPPPGLFDALRRRRWPGNVRELANAIEALVATSEDGAVDLRILEATGGAPTGPPGDGLRERVEAFERGLIEEALRESGGNRAEAARRLRIGKATLHDKLKKLGLPRADGVHRSRATKA